jgi:outer membrane protein assembly factor BamB
MRAFAIGCALLVASPATATDFAPRNDLQIVALDLATGALQWTHDAKVGHAHFELYPNLVVAYPHYDQLDRTKPIFLSPAGKPIADTRKGTPQKLSGAQWPRLPVVLDNGWELTGFSAGNTKDLTFAPKGSTKIAWTVTATHYPEIVLAHKDLALHAFGYLTKEARIYAHKRGTQTPAWTIDFNQVLKTSKADRQGRVAMQILDGTLYAQVGQFVFAIAPDTGKIVWQLDAATAAKITYREMYGGALDIAVMTREKDMLVAAFERHVFAIHAQTGALQWHLDPDTFPNTAFPIAASGVVYLTSGTKRTAAKKP